MKPYIGLPVHFVDGATLRHYAAIVVWIWENGLCNLNVQDPGIMYPIQEPVLAQASIPHDEANKRPGTWHFIEDVVIENVLDTEPADEHN